MVFVAECYFTYYWRIFDGQCFWNTAGCGYICRIYHHGWEWNKIGIFGLSKNPNCFKSGKLQICLPIKHFANIEGQIIFAAGGLLGSFIIMQVGRFVFGIGGESLAVAQNTYAVTWFKGKELNMVFGFQVSWIFSLSIYVNDCLFMIFFKFITIIFII